MQKKIHDSMSQKSSSHLYRVGIQRVQRNPVSEAIVNNEGQMVSAASYETSTLKVLVLGVFWEIPASVRKGRYCFSMTFAGRIIILGLQNP